jgi:hypothetical protein
MTDPAAFLASRLVEAERTALDASTANGREWTFYRGPIDNALITGDLDGPFSCVVAFDEGAPSEPQAAHIADNDPAHVLRLIAAHRGILAKLAEEEKAAPEPVWGDLVVGTLRSVVRNIAWAYGWTEEQT